MEAEILRKLQPQSHGHWQTTKESHLGGRLQEPRGIKWRRYYLYHFARH